MSTDPARVFVIAEAGVNHNGDAELGMRLVEVAARAGADAVKFQSFRADALVSAAAPRAAYQERNQPGVRDQLEMLRRLELDEATQRRLSAHAGSLGIEFMSTPFDHASLALLADTLRVRRIKIASGEITNAPLLLDAARRRLPMVVSTGMCTLDEVEAALGVIAFGLLGAPGEPGQDAFRAAFASATGRDALARHVTLLHCTSDYPAPVGDMNLLAMDTLRARFGLPVGLSDHSAGIAAAIAAAARGAAAIEKHFTLDRALPGPDHRASLEPAELGQMIACIRDATAALGRAEKAPTPAELDTRSVARRSLVAARDIPAGARITAEDIAVKRPGDGVSPMYYWSWIGRVAERSYARDEPL